MENDEFREVAGIHRHLAEDGTEFAHMHYDDLLAVGIEVNVNITVAAEMSTEALFALRNELAGAAVSLQMAAREWAEHKKLGLAEVITFQADQESMAGAIAVLDQILMKRGMVPIEMIEVESSNVAKVGFREVAGTDLGDVIVEFRNGGLYAYQAVPKDVFDALLAAESVGRFLNMAIKPVYSVLRIDVDNPEVEVV